MLLTNSGFPEANPQEGRNGLFHREKNRADNLHKIIDGINDAGYALIMLI